VGVDTETETLRLGQDQTRTFVAGVNKTAVTGGHAVYITATGQLGVHVSSARYKQDIAPLGAHSEQLQRLRPVTFHHKQEPEAPVEYGLIAEEVATVYPELVTRDADGELQGVRYEALIPLLLNEVQQQHRQLNALRDEVAELKAQNEGLRTAVGQLREAQAAQPALQVVAIAQTAPVLE
jgi:hypothetical protein